MNTQSSRQFDAVSKTVNRRRFLQSAALSGAVALTGKTTLHAQLDPDPGTAPKKSVSKPAAAIPAKGTVPLAPPEKQPADLVLPEPVKRKAGWAMVGLGELALGECVPAFRECQHSRLVALVSGHPGKAQKVAEATGVKPDAIYDYENFDKIAENPEIDIVYIALPNSMHAEFTIRALKAGKHVLCEKPMAATSAEAEQMIAAAKAAKKKLSIAYRLHYEPVNLKAAELCQKKAFGKIKTFAASNNQNVEAPNIRLSSKLAGGPVGDVGVYCINAARYTIGEEPAEVSAIAHQPQDDPRFAEVPESVVFTMKYPSGVLAHCDCSFGSAESRRFRVHCEKGFIDLDPAFSCHGLSIHVMEPKNERGGPEKSQLKIQEISQFASQFDHFSKCVLEDTETRTPGEMGLADMKIVEAIHRSIKSGKPEKV